jgi:nicotinamide phosphoribosyltransferase
VQNEDGIWIGIAKSPITDPGKKSKEGVLDLIKDKDGNFQTIDRLVDIVNIEVKSELETYYRNGFIYHNSDELQDIRDRINKAL